MFNPFQDGDTKGSLAVVILSIFAILISGMFFGFTYYIMDYVDGQFQTIDCEITGNDYVSNCQELFELSIYPFLALRDILVWASFFFIFGLVIGMLVLGYRSGKSPVLMGFLVTFVIVLTYIGIEISNIYRTMLENAMFRTFMVEFTVYNRVMLYFPWFVFIISLMAVMLSIANFQRTKVNSGVGSVDELDY